MTEWWTSRRAWWAVLVGLLTLVAGAVVGEAAGAGQAHGPLHPVRPGGGEPGKLPSDRGARIILYCRSGAMSATAARALVKRGYTDVWNLDGGMLAWEHAGYPLRRGPR